MASFKLYDYNSFASKRPACKAVIAYIGSNCSAFLEEINSLFFTEKFNFILINCSEQEALSLVSICRENKIPCINYFEHSIINSKTFLPKSSYSAALLSMGSENNDVLDHILKDKNATEFSHLAYQSYLYKHQKLSKLQDKYFEQMRLGEIRDDILQTESLLRNKDYFFINLDSLRYSDYPYSLQSNPNGLYAEEICHIARYIGLSLGDKQIFIYNSLSQTSNICNICTKLIVQIIWHICSGIIINMPEFPCEENLGEIFNKKIVKMGNSQQEINFITSTLTGRWWICIPLNQSSNYKLVPCSFSDYKCACTGEIPLRWLFFYQKYNQ